MPKQKSKRTGIFFDPIENLFTPKNKQLLHTIEWIFILCAFVAVGFPIIYYQAGEDMFGGGKLKSVGIIESTEPFSSSPSEAEKKFIGETIEEPIVDLAGWDTYQNKWYGFEIQHPEAWTNMQYKSATEKSARYETMYKFRKNGEGEGDKFIGFDVTIYPVKKIQGIENTNDIHKKENMPEDTSGCTFSEEVILKDEEMKYQKVSIGLDNPCYEPAYFYSIEKGNYIYNIIPTINEDEKKFEEPEKITTILFPEYKEVASSLKFIPISRPVAQPAKPRITAKRPVSAKIVGGKMVCAKKNDKPHKSKQNKPGHLDLECCLDPDERPNPWCTY